MNEHRVPMDADGVPVEDPSTPKKACHHCGCHRDNPTLGRASVILDGAKYRVWPIRLPEGRAWTLRLAGRVPSDRYPPSLVVREHDNAELGCEVEGYFGLSCSCLCYRPTEPCAHLVALVQLGLLRPAPGWDLAEDLAGIWSSAAPAGGVR